MKSRLTLLVLCTIFACTSMLAQEMPKWLEDYNEAQSNDNYELADSIFEANFNRDNTDCCYINGVRQNKKGNYNWAIGWFKAALKNHNASSYFWKSTIYIKLAEVYNQLEQRDEALECLINAKKDNFANHRADEDDFIRIAEQYELMGQYSDAEEQYYHILRYIKNNEEAKIALATLYLNYAPSADSLLLDSMALSLLNDVITLRSSCAKAYYTRGQYYQIFKKDYKAAISDYLSYMYYDTKYNVPDKFYFCAFMEFQYAITSINQWVKYCSNTKQKREKNRYFFIRKRAKVYENYSYYREAIEDYTEVLEEDPEGTNKLWALPARGDCYVHIYDYQHAIEDYTACIELSKDFEEEVYTNRAHAYSGIGRYEEAANDWTMVIKNSDNEDYIQNAYFHRGWIKEILHDDYGALRDYNRSIDINPNSSFTYIMRGKTYQRLHDEARAKQDFEYVLQIDTIANSSSRRYYALCFLGDNEGAEAWMQQIIASYPDDEGSYYEAACLYALMGRKQEAVQYMQKTLELGYRNIEHLKRDRDLDPIREMPEFKALLSKYESEFSTQKIEELLKKERQAMTDQEKLDLLREFKLSE